MSGTSESPTSVHDVIGHFRLRLERTQRKFQDRGIPVTTLTYAQSLDGCIAAADGRPLQLSNPESQELTHRLRTMHDAILVGINTVVSDDPRLNARLVEGKNPQPIVVDSRLRFPLGAKLLCSPDVVRPIIVTGEHACRVKESQLVDKGAQVIRLSPQEDGFLSLAEVLNRVKHMGLDTVMIEGGAKIIASVLASGLADQLVLTISPVFVGGLPSVAPRSDELGSRLPHLEDLHYQSLAGDLVILGDLRCATDTDTPEHEQGCLDRAAEESTASSDVEPHASKGTE